MQMLEVAQESRRGRSRASNCASPMKRHCPPRERLATRSILCVFCRRSLFDVPEANCKQEVYLYGMASNIWCVPSPASFRLLLLLLLLLSLGLGLGGLLRGRSHERNVSRDDP